MITSQQKVFFVFLIGFIFFTLSILFYQTDIFIYLFIIGMWMMMLSVVIYRLYGTKIYTPKLKISQKEQMISNIKLLIS
jgi:hypothetical protein